MKTTLRKSITMTGIFLSALSASHAEIPQHQSGIILPLLLHDSAATKTNTAETVTTADIRLQLPVRGFVEEYLSEHAEILEKIKQNNNNRFKTIQTILVKNGVPAGLMYLAVVESKLKNNASSGAGAAGIWQLMPETAKTLGLKVTGKTDERRHTAQSTRAAAKYLLELYNQFDDWLLVVAAYNCGAGNVYKAIKKSGSREFWKLQRYLPGETSTHVKRFIATHFYYEEKGSFVTLTKTERKKYLASLNEPAMDTPAEKKESLPFAAINHFNWILILHEQDEFILFARK